MAIQSLGSFENILNKYDANKWTKSADVGKALNISNDLKINDDAMADLNIAKDVNSKSFSELLTDSISNVNNLQGNANEAIQRLVSGESKNLHETMLAVEKADIAFRTMNQVRLKVIDAYKEIMRMQI